MPRVPLSSKILLGIIVLLLVAIGTPNLMRVRYAKQSHADFVVSEDAPNLQAEARLAGGGGGGGDRDLVLAKLSSAGPEIPDRKIIRTAGFELVVEDVPAAKAAISKIAERSGGFVESSESSKTPEGLQRARLTIRAPQERLDDVRDQIRQLAARVESDKTEAQDVTRQFVDSEARLHTLKAEESQYLAILKNARTVKDTVEVTEKLSDVRGDIEQLTGEIKYLSQQVEMSVITIALRTEADAAQADVRWRPGNQAKGAWHDLKQGMADFADIAISIVVLSPLIILWLVVIYVLIYLVLKISIRLRNRAKAKQPPASAT
jgi:hypothetical protein